jgi:hypothetical protein
MFEFCNSSISIISIFKVDLGLFWVPQMSGSAGLRPRELGMCSLKRSHKVIKLGGKPELGGATGSESL